MFSIALYFQREYKKEFAHFSAFHRHRINWLIHVVTIPLEWLSWLLVLCVYDLEYVFSAALALYYVVINSRMSLIAAVAHILFAFIARNCYMRLGTTNSLLAFGIIQVSAWALQVLVGHRLFEKNLPSMATNLSLNSVFLSVLMAWDYE